MATQLDIDVVTNLLVGFGRLEGKADAILQTLERHEKQLGAHDAHLNGVAEDKAKMLGITVGASAVVSILVTILGFFFKH